MSTDLRYLAFTAILTASLWIPYVVSQVMTNGAVKTSKLYRSGTAAAAVLGQTG
jgi:hypothetical protein